jgi:hypothetical protein
MTFSTCLSPIPPELLQSTDSARCWKVGVSTQQPWPLALFVCKKPVDVTNLGHSIHVMIPKTALHSLVILTFLWEVQRKIGQLPDAWQLPTLGAPELLVGFMDPTMSPDRFWGSWRFIEAHSQERRSSGSLYWFGGCYVLIPHFGRRLILSYGMTGLIMYAARRINKAVVVIPLMCLVIAWHRRTFALCCLGLPSSVNGGITFRR